MITRRVVPLAAATLVCSMMVGCGGEKNKSQAAAQSNSNSKSKSVPATLPAPNPFRGSSPPTQLPAPTQRAANPPGREPVAQDDTVYRRSDDRVVQNPARFESSGIKRYESRRLILYTDFDPDLAEALPPLADALFDQLTRHFGELPANREGTDFQATGYLMGNPTQFRTQGLLTDRVPAFENGRHLGYEFWVNGQLQEYYSRHLVFHEFTHCFMACVTGTVDAPPAWYMEGMAEYFATHRLVAGSATFGVMPENTDDYEGFGRIGYLNRSILQQDAKSISQITQLPPTDSAIYPWSWGLCSFLLHQPDLSFGDIRTHLTRTGFHSKFANAVGDDPMIETRWQNFLDQLCNGYDLDRAAISVTPDAVLAAGESKLVTIAADKGWQSTGVMMDQSGTYTITAAGRFQVNDVPKPWISEPAGVSVQYVRGERLGCLLGACYTPTDASSLNKAFKVGTGITATNRTGTLFLRVNDAMNSLANNTGQLTVTITRTQ